MLSPLSILLFFQEGVTSTEDGVEYTPYEGFNWLLLIVAIVTVAVIAFVVVKVFKGIHRSRNLERMAEDSSTPPQKRNNV